MRPKNSSRPRTDLWSRPASSETGAPTEVVTALDPAATHAAVAVTEPAITSGRPADAADARDLEAEIRELVRPYQVRVTDRTLSKTVK